MPTYDVELQLFGSRRGRRPEKDLVWMGLRGVIAQLLNAPLFGSQLIAAHRQDGWPGVQVSLALDDRLPDSNARAALLEAAQFARARWTIDVCGHPLPHPRGRRGVRPLVQGAHWYVRPNRGRRPLACFLVRETAKAYRARGARKARGEARKARVRKVSPRPRRARTTDSSSVHREGKGRG